MQERKDREWNRIQILFENNWFEWVFVQQRVYYRIQVFIERYLVERTCAQGRDNIGVMLAFLMTDKN